MAPIQWPRNELETARNQISDLRNALNEANAQINHLQEKLDKVSSQKPDAGNNQLISMNQKLRQELSAMTAKLETTEKQRYDSMEQVGYLNRVLLEAIAAEAELKAEIAQLKSNTGSANYKYVELETLLELQKVKDQRDGAMDRAAKYKLECENAMKKSKETVVLLARTKQQLDLRTQHLRSTNIGMERMRNRIKEQEGGKNTYKQGTCWNMMEPDAKKPLVKPMPERKSLVEELQDKIKTGSGEAMNHLLQTPSGSTSELPDFDQLTQSRKRQSNEKSPSKSASRESSIEPSKRLRLGMKSTSETIDDYDFLKIEPIQTRFYD